jgi:bifunctional non-homologous end joining protein LigD
MPPTQKKNRPSKTRQSAAMPSFVEPMLPTPIKLPFTDPQWLFEPKWDGYRALCFVHDGKVRFLSRNRNNLTRRFPELQQVAQLIKAQSAIIDGEIVALDRSGRPSFDALRYRRRRAAVCFYGFDLLYFDGEDVSQYPLVARKAALKRILRKPAKARIRYTDHIEGEGERLFMELEALALEGMVCKRKDSVYAHARSKYWLKVKTAAGRLTMQKRIETWGK